MSNKVKFVSFSCDSFVCHAQEKKKRQFNVVLRVPRAATYSRPPGSGGGARLSRLVTAVMGEDRRVHFGGACREGAQRYTVVVIAAAQKVCRERRAAREVVDSLRMRCLSREPVWGRLDMTLRLSPRSQRSLRLRSGLLP